MTRQQFNEWLASELKNKLTVETQEVQVYNMTRRTVVIKFNGDEITEVQI